MEKTPQNVTGLIYILSEKIVLGEFAFWMTNQNWCRRCWAWMKGFDLQGSLCYKTDEIVANIFDEKSNFPRQMKIWMNDKIHTGGNENWLDN